MNLSSWGHANISGTAVLTEPMSGKMGISEKLWRPEFPLYTTYFGCVPLLIFNIFHSTQPYSDLYHCLTLDFWSAAILFEKENEKTLSFCQIVVEQSQYCQQHQQFPDHVSFRVPWSMCSIDSRPTCDRHVNPLSTNVLVELPLMSADVSTVTISVGYQSTTGGISVNYPPISGAHQMEPLSTTQALAVNPFPNRFINRTAP